MIYDITEIYNSMYEASTICMDRNIKGTMFCILVAVLTIIGICLIFAYNKGSKDNTDSQNKMLKERAYKWSIVSFLVFGLFLLIVLATVSYKNMLTHPVGIEPEIASYMESSFGKITKTPEVLATKYENIHIVDKELKSYMEVEEVTSDTTVEDLNKAELFVIFK